MAEAVEVARCPSCHKPIYEDHPYSWCKECGEPLPEEIRQLLPSQRTSADDPTASGSEPGGGAAAEPQRADEPAPAYRTAERFAFANPGWLTLAFLAACVALAPLTLVNDPQTTWAREYAWGAQINSEIDAGEWWRLLSAAFLHGGWGHLLANAYALFVVGSVVEYAFGHAAFLVIYVLAAIGGSIASFFFLDAPSVGASGAIFGLFGAALWLLARQRDSLGLPLSRSQLSGLGWWAAYSLFRGFTDAHINNAAHLGGLATGAAIAALLPSGRVALALAPLCATMLALTGVRMGLSAREAPLVEAYLRGVQAAENKDQALALRELDRAVPLPRALEARAALRLDLGDYKGVIADADALLASRRRGESRRTAYYLKAAALLRLGLPAQALPMIEPALASRRPRMRSAAKDLKLEITRALPGNGAPASVRDLGIAPATGTQPATLGRDSVVDQPAHQIRLDSALYPRSAVKVRGVIVGRHRRGGDAFALKPTLCFGRFDTIYVLVPTEGTAPRAVIRARWIYQTDQLIIAQVDTVAPTGPANTEFHIMKRDAWPAGRYRVEITLDGRRAGRASFEVVP